MGCSSSAPLDQAAKAQGDSYPKQPYRPVANVPPQQQQQQQQQQQHITPDPKAQEEQRRREEEQKRLAEEQRRQEAERQQAAAAAAAAAQQQQQIQQQQQQQGQSKDQIMELFRKYVASEKDIRALESKNSVGAYQMKRDQLADIRVTVQQMEQHYQAACKKVEKEKADVDNMNQPSVRAIMDQTTFDAQMSKEQEEYLEAVNEKEVAEKQLEGIRFQTSTLEKEVGQLEQEVERIKKLYEEQDGLLESMFNGAYGSDKENMLEREVDSLMDRSGRIQVAQYKWKNGQVLLQHACNQMAFAVRRWTEVPQISGNDPANNKRKYDMVTECRNNLIAATQNIENAQRYLSNIKFPYCDHAEMETLKRATCNIYVDMMTRDRHEHAYQCYSTTHKRAAALLQWFDSVINNTINRDLENARKQLNGKRSELRAERLRLIKEMVGAEMGDQISEKDLQSLDDGPEPELQAAVSEPDNVVGGDKENLSVDRDQAPPPTPLPLNELAPPPSQDEIFGNIEELKKQHEQEMQEFTKAQQTNKARMEQGLQEKLQARRSRRRRMEAQEAQQTGSQ